MSAAAQRLHGQRGHRHHRRRGPPGLLLHPALPAAGRAAGRTVMTTRQTAPAVAVTGVTGGLGGLVSRALAQAGVPLRLLARTPSKAPQLQGSTVERFDYSGRNDCSQSMPSNGGSSARRKNARRLESAPVSKAWARARDAWLTERERRVP